MASMKNERKSKDLLASFSIEKDSEDKDEYFNNK